MFLVKIFDKNIATYNDIETADKFVSQEMNKYPDDCKKSRPKDDPLWIPKYDNNNVFWYHNYLGLIFSIIKIENSENFDLKVNEVTCKINKLLLKHNVSIKKCDDLTKEYNHLMKKYKDIIEEEEKEKDHLLKDIEKLGRDFPPAINKQIEDIKSDLLTKF